MSVEKQLIVLCLETQVNLGILESKQQQQQYKPALLEKQPNIKC